MPGKALNSWVPELWMFECFSERNLVLKSSRECEIHTVHDATHMHIYWSIKRSIINRLFEFCFYYIFWLWERGNQLLRKVCVEIDHLPSSSNFQMGSYKTILKELKDLMMKYAKSHFFYCTCNLYSKTMIILLVWFFLI